MTKTPTLIDMHKSCHHSRVNTSKDPFLEKKFYKYWRAKDTDELIDTATLVQNKNFIAPKSNKINGTGWQCHMSKLFKIYYNTFQRNEIIENEFSETVDLSPGVCELMVRNKRCNIFDMIFGVNSSCFYEGVRVLNYEWLKQKTGVVYKCNYCKLFEIKVVTLKGYIASYMIVLLFGNPT
jgi:hypothetical protein